ncbi:LuxR C-terminal-related transcriptional regulator [Streptomyces sp. NPDC051909]|uniref:helix-turn-helix transcriptional regulator n=1 Tax=Streptomyces sp. NPDC051909 TaxID=3154944 RepID=UPI00343B2CA0
MWPLVGRDAEMRDIAAAWASRGCRVVVIAGPAGVGKTRLAEECLAQAVAAGYHGGRAAASAAAAAIPLGAIAHLLPSGVDTSDPVKVFTGVARGLQSADRRQRMLWIDDIQLLDSVSAVLLRQLVDSGVIRMIGTMRSGEPLSDPVRLLIDGDAVRRFDLPTLNQEQTNELLQAALGGAVGRRTVHELHTASGGNVLYLKELVTGALASGALASEKNLWNLTGSRPAGTPKMAELIAARLAAAGPAARPALELLALCEPTSAADLQSVVAEGVLLDLEESGLVHVTVERRRVTFRLAHPLYGEVLRTMIPVQRSRALLLEQARRAKRYGARRREDVLHIATWLMRAGAEADSSLLVQAANLARHVHDYERVVSLLEILPDEDHTTRTLLLLGESLFELGKPEEADAVLLRAAALAKNDQERLEVFFTRIMNLYWQGRVEEALILNEAATRQLAGAEERRILRINEGYMRVRYEPRKALEILEEMKARPPVKTPETSVWLLGAMFRPIALANTGRTAEAVSAAEEAYAIHLPLDESALLLHPVGHLITQVVVLTDAGKLRDARDVGLRAKDMLTEIDSPITWIWLSHHLGFVEWLSGHPASAHHWYAECVAHHRKHQHLDPRPVGLALSGLAACAALLGDTSAAEAAMDEAATYPSTAYHRGQELLGQAWLQAGRGRLREARELLIEASRFAHDADQASTEALLLTDAARMGAARDVAGRLRELAALSDGGLAPARAHYAAALATDNPEQLLSAAVELEAVGADLLAAEAAAAAAAAWRGAGHPRQATAADRTSQTCAARCENARTPLLAIAEAASPLTGREREIALLAAHGTASKEIAQSLHLSVRTVDNHIQHAYTKLGVTTRRDLARALGVASA